MYEVFNWGHVNESRPKRLSLFVGASDINIDDPPPPATTTATKPAHTNHSRPNGERHNLRKNNHFSFSLSELLNRCLRFF